MILKFQIRFPCLNCISYHSNDDQMQIPLLVLVTLLLSPVCSSSIDQNSNLSLTIYSSFGVVKDLRNISFDSGVSSLSFSDVATTISPETVMFRPKKEVDIQILEQNYENYLASKESLLKSCVGQVITVDTSLGNSVRSYSGKLYSYSPSIMLGTTTGVVIVNQADVIQIRSLPDSMLLKPALVWKVNSQAAVTTECQVSYRAGGFGWKADYILTLSQHQDLGSFAGWVTIDNNSGKKYVDTRLKLVAGDVNTIQSQPQPPVYYMRTKAMGFSDSGFQEKSFSDYHMYTLPRRVTVNQSSQKQIEFIPTAETILIDKYYVISISAGGYSEENLKAQSTVVFNNSGANGLGLPLPKGTIRVFKKDDDEALQFVGEDTIQHTPKLENVTLKIGNAFDITAKKTSISRLAISNGYQAKLKLTINNRGEKPARVKVEFNNYYADRLLITTINNLYGNILTKESANKYVLFGTIPAGKSGEYQWNESYKAP